MANAAAAHAISGPVLADEPGLMLPQREKVGGREDAPHERRSTMQVYVASEIPEIHRLSESREAAMVQVDKLSYIPATQTPLISLPSGAVGSSLLRQYFWGSLRALRELLKGP